MNPRFGSTVPSEGAGTRCAGGHVGGHAGQEGIHWKRQAWEAKQGTETTARKRQDEDYHG